MGNIPQPTPQEGLLRISTSAQFLHVFRHILSVPLFGHLFQLILMLNYTLDLSPVEAFPFPLTKREGVWVSNAASQPPVWYWFDVVVWQLFRCPLIQRLDCSKLEASPSVFLLQPFSQPVFFCVLTLFRVQEPQAGQFVTFHFPLFVISLELLQSLATMPDPRDNAHYTEDSPFNHSFKK